MKGRHGAAGFGVCPAGFGTCFYPVLPHCALIPPFWNGNVYSVPLSVGSVMIYGRGDPGKFHGWWEAGGGRQLCHARRAWVWRVLFTGY